MQKKKNIQFETLARWTSLYASSNNALFSHFTPVIMFEEAAEPCSVPRSSGSGSDTHSSPGHWKKKPPPPLPGGPKLLWQQSKHHHSPGQSAGKADL